MKKKANRTPIATYFRKKWFFFCTCNSTPTEWLEKAEYAGPLPDSQSALSSLFFCRQPVKSWPGFSSPPARLSEISLLREDGLDASIHFSYNPHTQLLN